MTQFIAENFGAAAEFAHDTWEDVFGFEGEIVQANRVLDIGLSRLCYLERYRSWDVDNCTQLESAIRGLRTMVDQRAQSAEDFVEAAVAESLS